MTSRDAGRALAAPHLHPFSRGSELVHDLLTWMDDSGWSLLQILLGWGGIREGFYATGRRRYRGQVPCFCVSVTTVAFPLPLLLTKFKNCDIFLAWWVMRICSSSLQRMVLSVMYYKRALFSRCVNDANKLYTAKICSFLLLICFILRTILKGSLIIWYL